MTSLESDFTLENLHDDASNPFARQEAIEGWSQDILRQSHILVVGAGALGNEVLKNLALLGVGNIYIVDRDAIEVTNLSRSILFSVSDNNESKAKVAAIKTQQLCVEPSTKVWYFEGDVVHQLGLGVFRRMDLVLGTLDNIEARIAVCKGCWAFDTPWVDGSMAGYAGNVTIYNPPHTACYRCTLAAKDYTNLQQSYSCDRRKRRLLAEQKIPAVQTVSAMVAAIQVHEGIKVLFGESSKAFKNIAFDSHWNYYAVNYMKPTDDHDSHFEQIDEARLVQLENIGSNLSISELAKALQPHFGNDLAKHLHLESPFVTHATCRKCRNSELVNRPLHTIYSDEFSFCANCHASNPKKVVLENDLTIMLETTSVIPLDSTFTAQNYTLNDLGISSLGVFWVEDEAGHGKYVELSGALDSAFERTNNSL